jgi:hypothetical protein
MAELTELDQLMQIWPPAARKELEDFITYLQFKYQSERGDQLARLGGLWSDIILDPSDEDVRALREKVTQQLLDKV